MKSNMYGEAVTTWNPYVGCRHRCTYCVPSFQRQAKRQKKRCLDCYNFDPHFHPERLKTSLPRTKEGEFIATCLMGDIAFARKEWIKAILDRIAQLGDRTFLLQSKAPYIFTECEDMFGDFPENLILGTTIETNDGIYTRDLTHAPSPFWRYKAMMDLNHPRKCITIEPILQFDLPTMVEWARGIAPEVVYVGYDTKKCKLDEPALSKTMMLIAALEQSGLLVRQKMMRQAWWEDSQK